MSGPIKDGKPAFPVRGEASGMTLQWFADHTHNGPGRPGSDENLAERAYLRADAMLAERDK